MNFKEIALIPLEIGVIAALLILLIFWLIEKISRRKEMIAGEIAKLSVKNNEMTKQVQRLQILRSVEFRRNHLLAGSIDEHRKMIKQIKNQGIFTCHICHKSIKRGQAGILMGEGGEYKFYHQECSRKIRHGTKS